MTLSEQNQEFETTKSRWEGHYQNPKSRLVIPDENVVRYFAPLQERGRLLDFGAGPGRNGLYLRELGWEVFFYDYAPASRDMIRQTLKQSGGSPEQVLDGTDSLPAADFDAILAWGVLHYNPPAERDKLLSMFHRILKPGGRLLLSVRAPGETYLKGQADAKMQIPELKDGYLKLYSRAELEELLATDYKLRFGYIERAPLGELDRRLCHWIVEAVRLG